MKHLKSILLGCTALSFASTTYAQDPNAQNPMSKQPALTIIHAGKVLSVPGKDPLSEQTIYIRGTKIEKIVSGYIVEKGASIIDLTDNFVLPGLIDSHVHLSMEFNPNIRLDRVTKRPGDIAYDAWSNANKTLLAGFTAVQDVGGPEEIFALRDAVNKGTVSGPRIRASGRAISPTGGHGDTHGYRQDILDLFHSPTICDGPSDCRRATRTAIKAGADVVKITATGGVLSNTAAGTEQQFFDDELEAIADTAAKMGRKVTAHAHGKTGIDSALRAGIKSIEHGTYLDVETARLFKKHDAVLVPTVLAGMTVVDWAKNKNWLPPASKAKALKVGPQMKDMLSIAYTNGVTIAFGTDTGVSKHGDNAREFGYMVDAGMSEMDAIKAATITAAAHLEMGETIGTIEPGKFADIIAVNGNPLTHIEELYNVDFVMKNGVVYKGGE